MKRVKYDPKLVTLPAGGRHVKNQGCTGVPTAEQQGLRKLTQRQLDTAIRKAKGKHAVEELVEDTPGWQIFLLDDGSRLQVFKFTGTVFRLEARL